MGDIGFRVPHKTQMGEPREPLCDDLNEVRGDIGDRDIEALDGGRGSRGERDNIARCILQLHLGVFFWLQY